MSSQSSGSGIKSSSAPKSEVARMAERRWERIRNVSKRVQEQQPAPAAEKSPPTTSGRRRNWLKWCTLGLGIASLAVAVNAGVAWSRQPSRQDLAAGKELFAHAWVPNDALSKEGDGLGPVFNARSCVECHFQGGMGGGGGRANNVSAFEVLPTVGHPLPLAGVIHASATQEHLKESKETVSRVFPIVPKGVTITAVCQQPLQKDYDPVVPHTINTPTLFGAGAIDQISDTAIRAQMAQRLVESAKAELNNDFTRPTTGRIRILADGRIGKFGWKAQFATLEEFVDNACAVEVGLTTPTRKQHLPRQHREDPTARPDLDAKQLRQLVLYVASLPAPKGELPADSSDRSVVERGRQVFEKVGCIDCHVPNLGGADGVYSDFCLHDVTEKEISNYTVTPEVPVPESHPLATEWKTPPLWGVGETAPYMHDGSAATLRGAIDAHGGQARLIRAAYYKLSTDDQTAVIRFLESLRTDDAAKATKA